MSLTQCCSLSNQKWRGQPRALGAPSQFPLPINARARGLGLAAMEASELYVALFPAHYARWATQVRFSFTSMPWADDSSRALCFSAYWAGHFEIWSIAGPR